jgi:predicted ribonuclease toxin of YeeF-YezG toxin-antitoxin module
MPTIKIDNQEYELDSLSNEAKAQLASLQYVDAELMRLQAQTAAYQTARMAYAKALQAALPAVPESDTIKLA